MWETAFAGCTICVRSKPKCILSKVLHPSNDVLWKISCIEKIENPGDNMAPHGKFSRMRDFTCLAGPFLSLYVHRNIRVHVFQHQYCLIALPHFYFFPYIIQCEIFNRSISELTQKYNQNGKFSNLIHRKIHATIPDTDWNFTAENDEYWHTHVDRRTYGSFDYTCLLYLSTWGEDFDGGEFLFDDRDSEQVRDVA